jgi:CHAT domain-containing protein
MLVPFDGLFDGQRYLIEDWRISYLASGRQLAHPNAIQHRGRGVTVFGNPEMGGVSLERSGSQSDLSLGPGTKCLDRNYSALPNTQLEVDAICANFPNDCKKNTGALATETELKKELLPGRKSVTDVRGPRVLHIATHGYYVNPPRPDKDLRPGEEFSRKPKYRFLRSGLIFSDFGRGIPSDDGVATSLELAFLDLSETDLVVLSACDSGIEDTTPGDNLSGMRGAFHVAGARAVISSLWNLDDIKGREIMDKFYEYLSGKSANGYTVSEALRQAKLAVLKEGRDRGGELHPHFWASFVMEGRDDVLFENPGNKN